jgi:plasmid maintenance system antidote protein VapI
MTQDIHCEKQRKAGITQETFGDLLRARGLTQEAMAVLGEVETSTISRIVRGQTRARPQTIVRLARALGIGAKRMQAMCDAHWLDAHPDGQQLERIGA